VPGDADGEMTVVMELRAVRSPSFRNIVGDDLPGRDLAEVVRTASLAPVDRHEAAAADVAGVGMPRTASANAVATAASTAVRRP